LNLVRFTFLFAVFVTCIGLLFVFLDSGLGRSLLIPKFWVIFGGLAVLTLMAYYFSLTGIRKGGEFSVYAILGAIIVKLLISMLFALVYLLRINVDKVIFVIDFISIYFLFSGFEIWALLTNLRDQNKSE